MDRRSKVLLAKNAAVNLVRGGSVGLIALVLPRVLTRALGPDAYGVWALILQFGAYVNYLDLGLQTAIGRYVAHANAEGRKTFGDSIVSTAMVILSIAAGVALLFVICASYLLPRAFPQMPLSLRPQAQIGLLLVGSSLALGLPATAFGSVFVGLQRNEVPATLNLVNKVLTTVALIVLAQNGRSLVEMAMALAFVNIASYLVQFLLSKSIEDKVTIRFAAASRACARELLEYCGSLTVWSISMLLVSGLDLTIVGVYDYRSVPYYAIAAGVVGFITGSQNAVFSAAIPTMAVVSAQGDAGALGRLVIKSTRYNVLLLMLTGIPLICFCPYALQLWLGKEYASQSTILLQILTIANIVRMTAMPYAVALIGTGQQKHVILSPVVEGASNLLISVTGAHFFGAIGVAAGTLAGAVVGVGLQISYSMKRTNKILLRPPDFVRRSIIEPALCFLPIVLAFLCSRLRGAGEKMEFVLPTIAAGCVGLLCWRCVERPDRQWFIATFRRALAVR